MKYLIVILMSGLISCSMQQKDTNQQATLESRIQQTENVDTATFAGGCFWCVEASFEQIQGVLGAVSGYAGGTEKNPTYEKVSSGATGYAEVVQVYYNPEKIDYNTLLDIFFTAHDPTQLNRQGPDIGPQYRSEIFYHDQQQQQQAKAKIEALNKTGEFKKPVVTKLSALDKFYPAEEYHQDYEMKHPDNPYIQNVSRPKINKVKKKFKDILKESAES
jgi:peptide-methionine (S)-S-oxide reductase